MSAADILAGHDDMVEQQPSMEIKVPFKVYNRQEQIVVEASIPEGFWQQFNWKEEFTVNNVLAFTQRINFNELKMNYNNGRLKVEIPQQKVFKHK
jgi:HSP20 family molecular chaperone IbpA